MVDARGIDDEDRLPWLEPVEDEDAGDGVGAGKLIAAVVMALVALGLVVGGVFWLRDRTQGGEGSGELIAAPEGAYKERPDDPGGMQVEGQGDVAYAASEGASTDAAIDLSRLPEAPLKDGMTTADAVAANQAVPATATPAAPPPAPAKAPPAAAKAPPRTETRVAVAEATRPVARAPAPLPAPRPAPAPSLGGGTIQLGAFSSAAKAEAAWKSLSGRYAYLAALPKVVTPVASGSSTLYRLRVTAGGQAGAICNRLKVAGETCATVG